MLTGIRHGGLLEHKAAKAGVRYVRVNPSHTSIDWSRCGYRQTIPGIRAYRCGRLRPKLRRDATSARNICTRPSHTPGAAKGYHPARRAIGTTIVRPNRPLGQVRRWAPHNRMPMPMLYTQG